MTNSLLSAHIAHETPHRLRLCAENLLGDPEACGALASNLRAAPVFTSVDVRANTGSIVLAHENERGAVLAAIAPFLEICTAPKREDKQATPPIQAALEMARRLDAALKMSSGGRLSLADTSFVVLCVTAAVQVGRGYIATPAIGMLSSAMLLASRFGKGPGASD